MTSNDSVAPRSGAATPETLRAGEPARGTISAEAALAFADDRRRRHTTSLRRFILSSPLGAISVIVLLLLIVVALIDRQFGAGNPEKISATARFASPQWNLNLLMGGDYIG